MSRSNNAPREAEFLTAANIFESALNVARLLAVPDGQARLAAISVARRITGIDLSQELELLNEEDDWSEKRALPIWEGAEAVAEYIANRQRVTSEEVAAAIFPGNRDRNVRMRIGKFLSARGWRGHRHRLGSGWTTTWDNPRIPAFNSGASMVTVQFSGERRIFPPKGNGV